MKQTPHSTFFRVSEHTLQVLEWGEIQKLLASFCKSPQGAGFCSVLRPGILSKSEAENLAKAAFEWRELSSELGLSLPLSDVPSLGNMLKRISRLGGISVDEFASLVKFQRCVQGLDQFLKRFSAKKVQFAACLSGIENLDSWARKHFQLLDNQGGIADSASQDLRALREYVKDLHEQIRRKLDDYLHNPKLQELMQDFYVTVRDGRYVLPIKVSFKNKVPGIVHDVSNTEQTVFIEPQEIVEWNNQLKVAEKEIEKEIERILSEVVAATQPHVGAFERNEHLVAKADFLSANAKLSESFSLSYSVPKFNSQELNVKDLLHPLLIQNKKVVANSFQFSQALILSGPNTGGKTVLLKALGLALLMAECGCLVPARDFQIPNSLTGLRANIGDEQSLHLNLSTFSGHLLFIREILDQTHQGDLVLIDEICTGTSPEEGQPLAQSIIEALLDKDVKLFVTTHYGGLKQFALIDERCRIAAMSFDRKSQSPTYQMEMDIPGESSAFDVAAQLGLGVKVIDRARALKGEVSVDLNRAIEKLETARKSYAERQLELEREIERAKNRENTAQEKIMELDRRLREGMQSEAREALKKFNLLREELSQAVKSVDRADAANKGQEVFQKISDAQEQVRAAIEGQGIFDPTSRKALEKDLIVGTVVELESFGLGIVKETPREFRGEKTLVKVQIGDLETSAHFAKLRIPSHNRVEQFKAQKSQITAAKERRNQDRGQTQRAQSSGSRICDIRGKTVDEGLRKVESSLNELAFNDSAVVTVIHGHGSDRLKDALRTYIEKERPELRFRSGSWPGEGGDGVTVIERSNV